MGDDYGPQDRHGETKNDEDRGHHCRIFDIAYIAINGKISKGLIRPVKYLAVPEVTFVADRSGSGQQRLQSDDSDSDSDGEGGVEINREIERAAIITGKETTLKSKNSWSSDDSDGGVALGHSLITGSPFRESRFTSSLDHNSPSSSKPPFNHPAWKTSRDRSLSPTNDGTLPCSDPQISPTTLHFHRKLHYAQHEHHHSLTPAPFTCTKTRKYMLSNPVPDAALLRSQRAESDLDNLTNELQNLHFRPSSPWVYSPSSLRKALRRWAYDRAFMENAERAERHNHFRGIDINEGWNRDRANGWQFNVDIEHCAPYWEGGPEMRMKITEGFNRFSLWSQLEPIEWDAEELKGMFDIVFVGEGLGNFGWVRKPGTWWAARRKVFDGHRGRSFLEEIGLWVKDIVDGLERWKRDNNGMLYAIGGLKRKVSSAKVEVDAEGDRRRTMVKPAKAKPEQVMSEAWRARRRIQEKKAGRWTDGTLRMDRMWAEFHWVLNADDPRDEVWPKRQF
jgi:hypothetical protein